MEIIAEENKTTLTFSDGDLAVNGDAIFDGIFNEITERKRPVKGLIVSAQAWVGMMSSCFPLVHSSVVDMEHRYEEILEGRVSYLNLGDTRCPITTDAYDDPSKRHPRMKGMVVEIMYEPKLELIPLLADKAT